MIVTATELRVSGLRGLWRFFRRMPGIRRQLVTADGLIFERARGFRTLTGWESLEAMKAFRNGGAHLDAMRHLREMGNAKSITWECDGEPDWPTALAKLREVAYPVVEVR